jgi:hypothetical protein
MITPTCGSMGSFSMSTVPFATLDPLYLLETLLRLFPSALAEPLMNAHWSRLVGGIGTWVGMHESILKPIWAWSCVLSVFRIRSEIAPFVLVRLALDHTCCQVDFLVGILPF